MLPLRFEKENPNILLVSNRDLSFGERFYDETKSSIFRYDLSAQEIVGKYKNEEQIRAHRLLTKNLPEYEHRIISADDSQTSFIARSYASDKPTAYYLVDTLAPALVRLGRPYPQLEPYQFSERKEISLESSDGSNIYALSLIHI